MYLFRNNNVNLIPMKIEIAKEVYFQIGLVITIHRLCAFRVSLNVTFISIRCESNPSNTTFNHCKFLYLA